MGRPGRSMENSVSECDLHCVGGAQDASEENSIMVPRNHSCDGLVKNMSAFSLV